jgi:hypothetical protein
VLIAPLIIPIAEITREFEYAPVTLAVDNVFPATLAVTEDVCTLAEMVMVELACPIPIPAPAESDKAPLEPLSDETLLIALDDPLIVRVNDPAADALAREILFPPTNATLIAAPVIDVPPPLKDCVAAPAATGAEIVIVPPDAPTDTAPAPEMLRLFPTVRVVEAAPKVFPAIVAVIVE